MSFDRKTPGDAEFERSLLESARKDAPPHGAQDAWARFAGALSLIAPSLAPDGDLGGPRVSAGVTSTGTVTKAASARAVRAAVMKWLLLGAIGGSAVTAAVMVPRREGKPDSPKPVPYRQPPAKPAASAPSPMPVPSPPDELTASSAPRTASPVALSRHPGRERDRSSQHRLHLSGLAEAVSSGDSKDETTNPLRVDSSTLSAEVSRIDAARTAISGGDYDEALRLIERYHGDFPTGALAPDADVVALEAVVAKGDRAEVRRRVLLFLARYPGDPHAARVKWMAAQRSE